jgi:hypothetical protein
VRLDGELFAVFTFYCHLLGLNRSTTLEHLMETWIRNYQPSVRTKLELLKDDLERLDPCVLADFMERLEQSNALLLRLAGLKSSPLGT